MKAPKVVSFDAFNTLFAPRRPVLQLYSEIAQRHGLTVPQEHLEQNFPVVFKQMMLKHPNYGKNSLKYINWWATVISNTYHPHETPKEFVEECIACFSTDEVYGAFEDARGILQKLHSNPEFVTVVASNGDPRIPQVLKSLDLLKYFQKTYISYEMNVSKPDRAFYDHIIDDLRGPFTPKDVMLQNSWHVGDELQKDLNGAVNAGWNGVLVDRDGAYIDLAEGEVSELGKSRLVRVDDKKTIISDLGALEKVLGL